MNTLDVCLNVKAEK